MRKKSQKILLAMLSVLCAFSLFAACNTGASGKNASILEGILTEIELGETVKFDEYLDYTGVDDYKLTVIDESNEKTDMTGRSFWTPQEPGKYTVDFTVVSGEKKGNNSFELTVSVPKLTWEYTLQNKIYDTGDTLVFADFFDAMNIAADSYYDWEMVMDSVTVNEVKTDFAATDTSYKFKTDGEHVFAFHIESEDGQRIGMTQAVRVRYVDREMLDWMEKTGVDAYNALSLKKDKSVVLAEGIAEFSGSTVIPQSSTKKIDSPYVAYNGNYGLNDFVVVDFTGNNMPIVSLFNEEVNNSFFYRDTATDAQNKGLVFTNGLTYGNGAPISAWDTSVNARYMVMGPNKTRGLHIDSAGWFRVTISNNMGMVNLVNDPEARFRLIVGVTAQDSTSFTAAMFLVNLDTGEVLEHGTNKVDLTQFKQVSVPTDYYSGSIALYGLFGRTTTLDKIYPIEHGDFADVVNKYYSVSEFLPDAETFVNVGRTLNVSDYIAPAEGANYTLAYYGADGEKHEITDETFSFATAGVYTLEYNDGVSYSAKLSLTVTEIDESMTEWVANNKVTGYNVRSIGKDGVVLETSTYTPTSWALWPNYLSASKGNADQSYVALNGNYGLNSFLVFDFTGNNFPYITFFDKSLDNCMFSSQSANTVRENEAIVISNGVTVNSGEPFATWSKPESVNDRLTVVGPYGAFDFGGDNPKQYFRNTLDGSKGNELALLKLAAVAEGQEKNYRVIVGFTAGTTTSLTLAVYAVNLYDGQVVYDSSTTITTKTPLSADYFGGSIALYGQFGKTTTLDKIYDVEKNTTLDAVKEKYTPVPKISLYKGTKDANNKVVLNQSSHVGGEDQAPLTANYNPDMSYVSFNGNYGLNDYLVFDFTGDNLPFISFFNKKVTNSCLNLSAIRHTPTTEAQKYSDIDFTRKSFVITNGVRFKNGNLYPGQEEPTNNAKNKLMFFGPYGIVNIGAQVSSDRVQNVQVLSGSDTEASPLSTTALAGVTDQYRVIIGFTEGETENTVKLLMYAVNLETGATVLDISAVIDCSDLASGYAGGFEEGSIALYGQFGKTTTLDKIYDIEEETTLAALKTKYKV